MTDKHEPVQPDECQAGSSDSHPQERKELPAAAQRALAEAEARRRAAEAQPIKREPEIGGRDGPDPARFGDWEKRGIISDF